MLKRFKRNQNRSCREKIRREDSIAAPCPRSTSRLRDLPRRRQRAVARHRGRRVRVRCTGFTDLVAVLPAPDGLGLFAIEAGGAVLHLSRLATTRSHSRLVTNLGRVVVGAHLTPDGASALILESGPAASLVEVDLATGTETTVAGPFIDPTAMAVDPGAGTATVLQGSAALR